MNDTSGPNSDDSSPSAALQSFLATRLAANLDVNGSPEYALTWKHWDMQSGQPICALRASARRISDSASSGSPVGWMTPQTFDASNGGEGRPFRYKGNAPSEQGNTRNPDSLGSYRRDLKDEVRLAGWPTPDVPNGGRGISHANWKGETLYDAKGKKVQLGLHNVAKLAGWPTPNALPPNRGGLQTNPKKALERRKDGHMLNLDDAVTLTGWPTPTSAPESPASHGQSSGRGLRDLVRTTIPTAGWPTPEAKNEIGYQRAGGKVYPRLGTIARSFYASTDGTGASPPLNPAFSLWLMGFLPEWVKYAPQAMR